MFNDFEINETKIKSIQYKSIRICDWFESHQMRSMVVCPYSLCLDVQYPHILTPKRELLIYTCIKNRAHFISLRIYICILNCYSMEYEVQDKIECKREEKKNTEKQREIERWTFNGKSHKILKTNNVISDGMYISNLFANMHAVAGAQLWPGTYGFPCDFLCLSLSIVPFFTRSIVSFAFSKYSTTMRVSNHFGAIQTDQTNKYSQYFCYFETT